MPGEVFFTPYGIPYVAEFTNVSIYPRMPTPTINPDLPSFPFSSLSRSDTNASAPSVRSLRPPLSLPSPVRSASMKLFRYKSKAPPCDTAGSDINDKTHANTRPLHRRNASISGSWARKKNHREAYVYQSAETTSIPAKSSPSPHNPGTLLGLSFTSSQITLVCPESRPAPDHQPADISIFNRFAKRTGGLYIRFPGDAETAGAAVPGPQARDEIPVIPVKTSHRKLKKLSRTIADAVVAAGMDTPESAKDGIEGDTKTPDGVSTTEAYPKWNADGNGKALFRGTYGQVRTALCAAGLVTTPCEENGFADGS